MTLSGTSQFLVWLKTVTQTHVFKIFMINKVWRYSGTFRLFGRILRLCIKWQTRWRWRHSAFKQSGRNIHRVRWNRYSFAPTDLHFIITNHATCKKHTNAVISSMFSASFKFKWNASWNDIKSWIQLVMGNVPITVYYFSWQIMTFFQ